MTSTTMTSPSPSSSSVRPKHIHDLPDLCLLMVFDHIPLLDLFNRIPLVCPRWTTLQSVALKRRTKLHLFSKSATMRKLLPEIIGQTQAAGGGDGGEDILITYGTTAISHHMWSSNWSLKQGSAQDKKKTPLKSKARQEHERIAFDTLPLPETYDDWTTGTIGGRLLHPQAVEWLWAKLPNITELSIMVLFEHPSTIPDHSPRLRRLRTTIRQQAILLVIGPLQPKPQQQQHQRTQGKAVRMGGWCTRLTTLRLHLWPSVWPESDEEADLADDLINEGLNHHDRMPLLTKLQLDRVPEGTTARLAWTTLAKLRFLVGYGYRSSFLWSSLCSFAEVASDHQTGRAPPPPPPPPLRPDLCIVLRLHTDPVPQITTHRLPPPEVLARVRSYDLVYLNNNDSIHGLDLFSDHFRELRSLSLLALITGVDRRDANWSLARVLARLVPLRSLVHLRLFDFNLMPAAAVLAVERDGNEAQPATITRPLLPSLQSLELMFTTNTRPESHDDLGRALHWSADPLPGLIGLSVSVRKPSPLLPCDECQQQDTSTDEASVPGGGGGDDSIDRCRRLAVEPLQACSQLTTVVLSDQTKNHTATRTDLSAPFKWRKSTQRF